MCPVNSSVRGCGPVTAYDPSPNPEIERRAVKGHGETMTSTPTLAVRAFTFSVHGVGLRFETDSPLLAEPARMLLRYFEQPALPVPPEITIRIGAVSHRTDIPAVVPADGALLYARSGQAVGDRLREKWECRIMQHGGRLFADFHDQGLVVIDPGQGRADAYLVRPEAMHADIVDSYVHFMLTELLRHRGLYSMHATALEKYGYGVLIPGYSGRGKTTSFLSLLRSGYRYLSDDHPLLRDKEGEVELLSFPMKVDVTEHTISLFPELRQAPPRVLRAGPQKRFFYVEDIYAQAAIGGSCRPALVLFPHVVESERSSLERLSKSRVLAELLPQGLVAYDKEIACHQFRLLSKLAQQVECYRLNFGRDVAALPDLIDPLLQERCL